ncbi:MAG: hypothetical protein H7318_00315 [Oligoflexus sp.]|nr:hypothetical protein [Oligoflexus sp.]
MLRFGFRFWALLLLWGVLSSLVASKGYALPFATGRAGGGYTYGQADKGAAAGGGKAAGIARFGYLFDDYKSFFAIDVNAYRFYKNKAMKSNNDGTNALLVYGYEFSGSTFWISAGAGEIRSYDREADKATPYRYFVLEQQFGYSYQLYSADYARVELAVQIDRMVPDDEWKAKTGLKSLNSIEFDVGFKLLNW